MALVAGLCACQPATPDSASAQAAAVVAQGGDGDHMVSINVVDAPAPVIAKRSAAWGELALDNGQVWISCGTDYAAPAEEGGGDGQALTLFDRASLTEALVQCQERGLVRVRYAGKINPSFAELMRRLATVADELKVRKRILDLDSSGGQVEAAVVAGDQIGETGWTIWVREGSVCHSACVFVLAAGDNRLISGRVGIHRMMRISSAATSRAELNKELHAVYDSVKDYLQRNGVAVGVADLMMTVPNRSLRLLNQEELKQYGLDGTNAVQDDLERIKQMRKCGDDFVRRKDAFLVAFDLQCKADGSELDAVTACGQALKQRFGFPDDSCPDESPLSEIDMALVAPPVVAPAVDAPAARPRTAERAPAASGRGAGGA